MKKLFFKSNSPCIAYLLFFHRKKKYSKVLNGDFIRQIRDPAAGNLGDQLIDVLGTSAGRWSNMFYKFNSQTYSTCFYRLLNTL